MRALSNVYPSLHPLSQESHMLGGVTCTRGAVSNCTQIVQGM